MKEAGLDQLRLGDVVALSDYDSSWNHGYLRNAVGIGVIAQGDSPPRWLWTGHQPDNDLRRRQYRTHGDTGRQLEGFAILSSIIPAIPLPVYPRFYGRRSRQAGK